MPDHSAAARADQPPANIAAVRQVMADEQPVTLTDAMIRAHCKRLLWRCWQELSADDRAAFLAHVQGGRDALHG